MPSRKNPKHTIVPYTIIHLGGSVVIPHISDEGGLNISFLKRFALFLKNHMKKGRRFVIVIGGGKTARAYQQSASKIMRIRDSDLDWIGIHATRLNAHLMRTVFSKEAHPVVIDHDPSKKEMNALKVSRKRLFFASGWRPGWSTDYVAVALAHKFGSKEVIIAKDTGFVYSADPKKNPKAKAITTISWTQYKKIIPSVWSPGFSSPVDPVATRLAHEKGMKAKILKATDLQNFAAAIMGKQFKGTLIQ